MHVPVHVQVDPETPDTDVDVLAWWKAKESKWPALAKMVKQYFAAPASSAGVDITMLTKPLTLYSILYCRSAG